MVRVGAVTPAEPGLVAFFPIVLLDGDWKGQFSWCFGVLLWLGDSTYRPGKMQLKALTAGQGMLSTWRTASPSRASRIRRSYRCVCVWVGKGNRKTNGTIKRKARWRLSPPAYSSRDRQGRRTMWFSAIWPGFVYVSKDIDADAALCSGLQSQAVVLGSSGIGHLSS